MWTAKSENVKNGHRILIYQGEDPVSFGAYLKLLEEDQAFASWFTGLLAGADYEAFFWEHPPLSDANIDSGVEFVLLDSPALARLSSNPEPFRSHFERDRQGEIVSFRSLGGDAVLLAPRPSGPPEACVHLAAFVRQAAQSQIENLWRETGRAMRENLSERKLWLSTSGLGVSWLHIRLDSYPKYYQHRPYATVP
ncbi:MAG: hypothetical protein V3R35_04240 [Woeseiaceae bacterium]